MNLTDLLIGIVVALIGTIAAMIVYIWNQHRDRVERKFAKNDEDHSRMETTINKTKVTVDKTLHAVRHVAKYHEGIPSLEDDL